MKKILFLSFLLICTSSAYSRKKAFIIAPEYRSSYGALGLKTQFMIAINDNFMVAPNLSYHFKDEYDNSFLLATDLHYFLPIQSNVFKLAPVIGVAQSSDSNTFARMGIGGRFNLGKKHFIHYDCIYLVPFIKQSKYEENTFTFGIGYGFSFGK